MLVRPARVRQLRSLRIALRTGWTVRRPSQRGDQGRREVEWPHSGTELLDLTEFPHLPLEPASVILTSIG